MAQVRGGTGCYAGVLTFCFGLLGQHEGKAARLERWERPPTPDSSLGSLLEAACRDGMATEEMKWYIGTTKSHVAAWSSNVRGSTLSLALDM